MESAVNFLETDRLQLSTGSCDISDISTSSSFEISSTPDDGESSGSETMEEVWSDDVEKCFYEALEIFPGNNNKKRIRMADGKVYGRNYLIACYIKQKCGKTRNVKQISSHLQVITRRQKLRAQERDSQPVQKQKNQLAEPSMSTISQNCIYSSHSSNRILFVPSATPIRYIASPVVTERVIPAPAISYTYDLKTRQILLNNGFGLATLPIVKLASIHRLFDATLHTLLQIVSPNAFYLVKGWINMEKNFTENMKILDTPVFSTPYKMDIDELGIGCSYGNRVHCTDLKPAKFTDLKFNAQNQYIYHQDILWVDYGTPVLKELSKLHKETGNFEAVKLVLNNFSYLTILTDKNTSQILLVIAYIFENSQQESSYKMFKLV